ncbi:hypothetical protein SAMN06265360_108186 [Haloechinothrix alba]|uniref:DUF4352 domain-containing protein n=1 Tax=Haloechinothrix alba TaxID=664784 RepID=A0A238X186_9PSEU|nr:hypothetical protein [Haloechinothrix alba]SNR52676.1 hypothetical protein SAMN06265360_108186 [Haloechinothrix alba]
MKRTTALFAGAAVMFMLAGCQTGPASGSGADVIDDETVENGSENGDSEAQEDESEYGTRANPLEIGTRIEMGEWSLAVTDVNPDATDEVLAANEFNEAPADGRQFVMFSVDASYHGEESGTAWLDFSWAVVGSAGNTFGGESMDDYCGVVPDPLDDTGETYPGGDVSGNVCISVPADQLDGGTIRIQETFEFGDTRAFYSLA